MNNSLKVIARKRVYHKDCSYIYKRKYDDIYRIVKINNKQKPNKHDKIK